MKFGLEITWVIVPALAWAIVIVVVDCRTLRIPTWLAWSALIPVSAALWAGSDWQPMMIGALALSASYFAMRMISPGGLGGGDLRLAPGCGALAATAGVGGWITASMLAFVITAIVALCAVTARRLSGGPTVTAVPHGPGMAAGTLAVFIPALLA